jgi:hypothetical protein
MRKLLLFLGIVGIVSINSASAQLAWGARVGVAMGTASFDGEADANYEGSPGIELGPTAYYAFSENVYLNTGLMLSFKNVKSEKSYDDGGGSFSEKMKFVYLDIPIYLGYAFNIQNVSLYGQAGPFIGFNLSAKAEWTETYNGNTHSSSEDLHAIEDNGGTQDMISRVNAGLGLAAGINIKKFKIEVGYQYGLTNAFAGEYANEGTLNIGSVFLGVSYVF